MRFQIITLFPNLFDSFRSAGLIGRAVEKHLVEIETIFLRDFAINKHGQVDDTPYGGGSGMLMRPEPAVAAIEYAHRGDPHAAVALFTPKGEVFNGEMAGEIHRRCISEGSGLILLCPRYEGFDERIAAFVDYEISIGDFVLMGGETAAMAVIETISRFIPGVLGNEDSLSEESFKNGLLEYPQYTKPRSFRGVDVPEVLLSGHHEKIAVWRKKRALEDTIQRRPDLLVADESGLPPEAKKLRAKMLHGSTAAANENGGNPTADFYVALIHYPVVDKHGKVITSSITNLDLHDIARSARTYGLKGFYVVHPTKALRALMKRICDHWTTGYGFDYNRNRSEALSLISLTRTFDDVLVEIKAKTGVFPTVVATSARRKENTLSFRKMRSRIAKQSEVYLLLLGTGWGLADEILERAEFTLEPIYGPSDYNHLSVRGAASIIFDRLFGRTSFAKQIASRTRRADP